MLEQYEAIALTKKQLTLDLFFFARVVNDANSQGEATEINSLFQLQTEGVSHKVIMISPNISGARKLIFGVDYSYDGVNSVNIRIDGASMCQGTHRLQVELRYGTNTLSVYGLDITVPYGELEDGTQEYEANIYAVETYGDGVGEQITIDAVPTEDSENAVSSGGTYTALAEKADASVYQVGESGDPAVSNVAKVYGHSVELSNSAEATGQNAVAEGTFTTASGVNSHAEGSSTEAGGDNSHAEGSGTGAGGDNSHAEGSGTIAGGVCSHAEGNGTEASGTNSHAEGVGTTASGDNQHVSGKYNVADTDGDYAFIVGNGSDDEHRSNAFAIDWNGNLVLFDNGTPVVLSPAALNALIAGTNI